MKELLQVSVGLTWEQTASPPSYLADVFSNGRLKFVLEPVDLHWNMTLSCDHQFKPCGTKDNDWLMNSSATCPLDGNNSVSCILQQLIQEHCSNHSEQIIEEHPVSQEKVNEDKKQKTIELNLYSQPDSSHYKISRYLQERYSNFKDDEEKSVREHSTLSDGKKKKKSRSERRKEFDESEHLDGCPVKWFHRNKSTDSTSSRMTRKELKMRADSFKKEAKTPTLKDCTPLEMKINKIRLKDREASITPVSPKPAVDGACSDRKCSIALRKNSGCSSQSDIVETQESVVRKNLAIKLNWRRFDITKEEKIENQIEGFKEGYLPPRPLLGLKPLLSILLSPRHSTCCSVAEHCPPPSRNDSARSKSAALSIKLLDLPEIKEPRTELVKHSYSLRWGTKNLYRLRQKPKKITLDVQKNQKDIKNITSERLVKKTEEPEVPKFETPKPKPEVTQRRSFYGDFYHENVTDWAQKRLKRQYTRYFDDIFDELSIEDKEVNIHRFLNMNIERKVSERRQQETCPEEKLDVVESDTVSDSLLNVKCSRVQFFERPGKPMK